MHERTAHGIVHAGFRGLCGLVAREKGQCKLIENCFVIPYDTISVELTTQYEKNSNIELKKWRPEHTLKNGRIPKNQTSRTIKKEKYGKKFINWSVQLSGEQHFIKAIGLHW